MLDQVDKYLALQPGEVFCDCTLGGAGHSVFLGRRLGSDGLLIGIDRDEEAIRASRPRLQESLPELEAKTIHGNFADLDDLLLDLLIPGVDAFLFDLGTSSHQLDTPIRGFSYSQDAPLDMRMDPGNQTLTAAEVINTIDEADLARIIYSYSEERWSRRIARAVVAQRAIKPFKTTSELVQVIRQAVPAATRRSGGNPAKRTFQALRIHLNSELAAIEKALEAALRWLNPGGRMVVLSYHSLEDRIVKHRFAEATQGCVCPPEATICVCGRQSVFESLTRKPETPELGELQANPRSSSARLRAVVRRV